MAQRDRAAFRQRRGGPALACGRAVVLALAAATSIGAQLPPETQRLAQQGVAARQEGRLEAAEAVFAELVERAPQLLPAWLNLGLVRHERKRYEEAVEAFERALALDPAVSDVAGLMGFDLVQLGRFEEAAPHLERALGERPDDTRIREALVRAHLGAAQKATAGKDLAAAQSAYRSALAVAPTLRGVRRTIADLDAELGDYRTAVEGYRAELHLGPDALAYERLGDALLHLGRSPEAVEMLRLAVAAAPDKPGPFFLLGKALHDVGDTEEAASMFEKALERNPASDEAAKAHYALGMAHRRLGNLAQASLHLERFQELRKSSGAAP